MPTNVISNNNDDELKTIRINTSEIDLGAPTDVAAPIRSFTDDNDDIPTVRVRPEERDASNDQKTILVRRPSRTPEVSAPAPAEKEEDSPQSWCVGWLVAVSGPMKGRAFQLRLGMNHVGRNTANDICLEDDAGVSRETQVVVTYDRKRNQFFVAPGMTCSQTSELNDNILLTPSPLAGGDVIQLSDETKLRFIAFCDSQFHWDY